MKAVLWHARRFYARIGWPGLAGLLLALATALVYQRIIDPLDQDVGELRDETLRLRSSASAHRGLRIAHRPGNELQQFYAFFRDRPGMETAFQQIFEAAAEQNLTLEQGEYRLAPEHDGQLVRYDLLLPVKGAYPQLRRFIARILKDNPGLALEGVTFSRQGATDIGVEAQLRLTLYLPVD